MTKTIKFYKGRYDVNLLLKCDISNRNESFFSHFLFFIFFIVKLHRINITSQYNPRFFSHPPLYHFFYFLLIGRRFTSDSSSDETSEFLLCIKPISAKVLSSQPFLTTFVLDKCFHLRDLMDLKKELWLYPNLLVTT